MTVEIDYRAVAERRQVYIGNLEEGFNRACELIVAAETRAEQAEAQLAVARGTASGQGAEIAVLCHEVQRARHDGRHWLEMYWAASGYHGPAQWPKAFWTPRQSWVQGKAARQTDAIRQLLAKNAELKAHLMAARLQIAALDATPSTPAARSAAVGEALRETLAALAHDMWSGWMVYLFGKTILNWDGSVDIPAALVERWQRQMDTAYADLSAAEQDSDRQEADRMLAAVDAALGGRGERGRDDLFVLR